MRGDHSTRLVTLYSSSKEINVAAAWQDSVVVDAGKVAEASLEILTVVAGRKQFYLSLTDQESGQLLQVFLISVTSVPPPIGKEYDIELRAGEVIAKRIQFRNPYDVQREFMLLSSDPSKLSFQNSTISCSASGFEYIRLVFGATTSGHVNKQYVFITNVDGGVEECFALTTRTYTT